MANDRIDQLGQAVNKLGVRLECPSCGRKEWAPYEHEVVLPASGGDGKGMGALAMGCTYCGFVRLHTSQALLKGDGESH